eukprot:3526350-Rhodomonas_salina.1
MLRAVRYCHSVCCYAYARRYTHTESAAGCGFGVLWYTRTEIAVGFGCRGTIIFLFTRTFHAKCMPKFDDPEMLRVSLDKTGQTLDPRPLTLDPRP